MIRLIAGRLRGRKITVPDKSFIRPTTNRVRESMFHLIESQLETLQKNWSDLRVLDAFAGSGALGLEAYSRGAEQITFIEKSYEGCVNLRQTIVNLKIGTENQIKLFHTPYERLENSEPPYDLIFLDPPYHKDLLNPALKKFSNPTWSHKNTLFVLESALDHTCEDPNLRPILKRKYGQTAISLYLRR